MIKGTRNQMHNVHNVYQGKTKRVLCVCSAGLLRSATLQNFLIKEYGYNVRNCGTVDSYALIPISEALLEWANEVVFVNEENFKTVEIEMNKSDGWGSEILKKCHVLNIPDSYGFNDPILVAECKKQYEEIVLKKEK